MDDTGEMSAWYVFAAMGLYPFSPANDDYLVSIPLFDSVKISIGENQFLIEKKGEGARIDRLILNGEDFKNFSLPHQALDSGGQLQLIAR